MNKLTIRLLYYFIKFKTKEKINNKFLTEQYNSNGEINLNKFQEETVNQKDYRPSDSGLNHIHISSSYSRNCSTEMILHLSSIINHIK